MYKMKDSLNEYKTISLEKRDKSCHLTKPFLNTVVS